MVSQPVFGPRSPQIIESTTGLIRYLRDVVRSSRRVVRDTAKFEDVVWLHEVPEGLVRVPDAASADQESLRVLTLDYEPRVAVPLPPRVLDGWLDADALHDPFGPEPTLRPNPDPATLVAGHGELDTVPRSLESRSHVQQAHEAFDAWLGDWREWAARRKASEPRQRLYDRLAKIAHTVSDHDDVLEAVLATGLLVWQPEHEGRFHRHLVTRRLRIILDGDTARLEVRLDQDAPLQLEDRDFLGEEAGFRRERVATLHERVSSCPQHPLSGAVGELVADWSRLAFDDPVRFLAAWQIPDDTPSEAGLRRISLAPAVVLRTRDRNAVVEVYERILTTLTAADAQVPLSLAQLIAPLDEPQRSGWAASHHRPRRPAPLEEDPLFPKSTNPQQRDVLDRLRRDTAAVVQGPPGTGKTHTIANLTAALLAQGLRVLVTSQKEQALAVLHEMLPPQVRDLCVMLAAGDNSGSGALERTLTALSDHAATVHQEQLEASIGELEQRRMLLLRQRAELEEDIRRLRETETVVHEPAPGYRGTPVELTYLVAQGEERHRWMPTPAPHAPADFPLGVGLFSQLRDLLRTMSPERAARTRQWFPDPAAVPDAEDIAERIARIEAGAATTSVLDPIGEAVARLNLNALERIEHLVQDAANCLHHLGLGPSAAQWRSGDWRTRALADALSRRNARQWERIAASAATAKKSLDAVLGLESVDISRLHPDEYATLANAARAWRDYLESGQQPRRMFPPDVQVRVKPLLTRCTISGSPPERVEDLNRVITVLEAAVTADETDALWRGVKVRAEAAPLAERLERQAARASALGHVGDFGTLRDEIDRELLAHGVRILLGTEAEWDAFIAAIASARARIHLAAEIQELDDLSDTLTPRGADTPAPEVEALRAAVRARDSAAYATAHLRYSAAQRERADQAKLLQLFAEMNTAHPKLARMLAEDPDNTRWDDPADVAQAWAWAVAAAFCEHNRAHGRDEQLGDELAATESRLLTVTGDLAGAKGWLHCLTRLDERQRRALAHLRSHLTAVGSGEGRYADRSRAAVRGAMATARDAVPAWIMPLHQVVENLPAEPDSFDVVIVDEASQVGLDG
ncbi:MAG TPA: AAA domain-containing protein, partial [Actinocrinis sp.]|nr:AAA domain-containing protein [Actinocrinis sp.]